MTELYAVSGETLAGIADAIRSKTGSDERMTVAAMPAAIADMKTPVTYTTLRSYNTFASFTTALMAEFGTDTFTAFNKTPPTNAQWLFVATVYKGTFTAYRRTSAGALGNVTGDFTSTTAANIPAGTVFEVTLSTPTI